MSLDKEKHVPLSVSKNRTFRFMLFVLFGFILSAMTTALHAQDTRISLNARNTTVREVLKMIETKSDYHFAYNNKLVDVTRNVDVTASNEKISDILKRIFANTDVTFTVVDHQIVLASAKAMGETGGKLKFERISGKVTDEKGEPLIGASVVVKGTTKGTITDVDGKYTLEVPSRSTILYSYIGYESREIPLGNSSLMNITLNASSKTLNEVVVTALGIKREKKALGYAVQEVKGSDLLQAHESNFTNDLSGKVAGLQVVRSSNGPGGSSKILLRGNNSLTGDNQPLIVVDGIPMNNFTGASNTDFWNPSVDMGNGLSDINPDDIASISILKGPSAAALYGSRAGNGVILITTKSGQHTQGLGIRVSSSTQFESLFMVPDMQNTFGQGTYGAFNALNTTSWGPQATGQTIKNWNGASVPMQIYNNVNNFFQTGVTTTENVAFEQQIKGTSLYTSFTRADDGSMVSGTNLARTDLMIHATSKFGKDDRWTLDTKVQYINAAANNRPINGQNASNYFATLFSLPRSLDIRQFNPPTDQYGKMIWFNTNGYNPYWLTKYNLNQDTRDRFLMYASLTYDFTKWLNLNVKAGSDLYSTSYLNKTYAGSPLAVSGSYGTSKDQFFENDYSTLLTAHKDNVFGKLGGMINLGGNLMYTQQSSLGGSAGSLVVPNLFTLNNAVGNPNISQSFSEQKINSLYGSLQLNWDGYLFLDGTLRNDWTSTLSPANRSFFYPSVNFSWVINDMLNRIGSSMPSWFDFAKLRASFAQVGNSLSPYQLYNTYSIGKDPLGSVTASNGSSTLFNANVKNELITSYEVGTELHFLQNRLSFDVSLYKSNATRQLLNLPIDPMSGYSSMKINAGNIQNQGIEVQASARILELRNSFTWDLQSNFSMNQNKIISLAPGVTKYQLGGYDNLQILAATGQNYGAIYGTKFARVSDPKSSYYGQMILKNGLPSSDGISYYLGSQQPNALWSITSSWGYKGFRLSMMFDMRFGGKMYSATNFNLQMAGVAAVTAPNGQRQDFVVPGVTSDGNGGYTPNATKVTVQDYWTKGIASSGNLGIDEANVYDATNFRIRNVELSYDFNKNILRNTPFQAIRLSASCNNVVMLYSKMHGVDPEAVFATSTNATGFENASQPTLRTYTFNVTFGF